MYPDKSLNFLRSKSSADLLSFALILVIMLFLVGISVDNKLINRMKFRLQVTADSAAHYVINDFRDGGSYLLRKMDKMIH
jgi:Flp pilus assembly protein TadG